MRASILILGLTGLLGLWVRSGAATEAAESHTTWYGNGQVKSRIELQDGVREGNAQRFHSNGALASEGSYADGRREGAWRFWAEDGSLDAERSGTYVAGRLLSE